MQLLWTPADSMLVERQAKKISLLSLPVQRLRVKGKVYTP